MTTREGSHRARSESRSASSFSRSALASPSAGASVAFADEHSDRLYVVRENDDGMLYLALSDALAAEETKKRDDEPELKHM